MEFNLDHLLYFFFAAKFTGLAKGHENMGRCGRKMEYSPFCSQIAALEKDLGLQLLQRKPFALTAAGQDLFDEIAPGFERLIGLPDRFRAKHGAPRLGVGAPELVLREHLLDIVDSVRKQFPNANVFMRDGDEVSLEEMVRRREIDVAVTVLDPLDGRRRREETHSNSGEKSHPAVAGSSPTIQGNGLCALPLFELPLALVVPTQCKWKSAEEVLDSLKATGGGKKSQEGANGPRNVRAFDGTIFMLPAEHAMTRYFQEGLKQRGIGIDRVDSSELETVDLIHASVRKGHGVGVSVVVPGQEKVKGVRLLPLKDFKKVMFGILWQGEPTAPMTAFIEAVKARVKTF